MPASLVLYQRRPGPDGPPVLPRRASIDEYPPAELDRVMRWICGNANKTDEEIVAGAVTHLGFARRTEDRGGYPSIDRTGAPRGDGQSVSEEQMARLMFDRIPGTGR